MKPVGTLSEGSSDTILSTTCVLTSYAVFFPEIYLSTAHISPFRFTHAADPSIVCQAYDPMLVLCSAVFADFDFLKPFLTLYSQP